MINLDEHKYFDFERKIESVPLSIAKKALEEAHKALEESTINKLDEAIKKIENACKKNNIKVGIHCLSPSYLKEKLSSGYDLATLASDIRIYAEGIGNKLKEARS